MKIIINIIIVFSMFILSISCNRTSDPNTIEFWTLQLSPVFDNYFNEIIKEYETQNKGIKIKWVDVPYDAAIQKLLSSLAAGNPPDVVNLSADFLAKFSGLNALENFYDYFSYDSLNRVYLPNALESCTFKNQLVALPWYLNTYCIIYNKSLLNKAGFDDESIPETFKELTDFIKLYKDKTGKYAIFWNIGKDSYLPMLLESEGVKMVNPLLTKALFNSKESIELISEWMDLYKTGYLPSESLIKSGASIIELYQSGQVALVLTGPVFLKRIKDNSPDIYKNTDIAPPVVGKTGLHELAAMSISVMKNSVKKKLAVDFALYVTNNLNQLKFCKLATIYPSTISALSDSFFTRSDSTIETRARVMGAKLLPDAVRLRKYLEHPKFDLLRDIFDESIQSIGLGNIPVRQALNDAVNKWDVILQESVKNEK